MQLSLVSNLSNRLCSLAVLAACASAAWAGPELAIPAQAGAPAVKPEVAAAPAAGADRTAKTRDTLGFGPAADLGRLEHSRGGTDTYTTTNNANLSGVVTGNSAYNVVTGTNTIDSGAFANMSGIPVVIQNSGANVLIQNATIVNLQFK
jgi:hypothetical protein